MNRMTSIVALACSFAFTVASPALTQEGGYKGPHEVSPVEGIEQDARIDKVQREKAQREEEMLRQQGRSSTTSAPAPAPDENLGTPREDLGR